MKTRPLFYVESFELIHLTTFRLDWLFTRMLPKITGKVYGRVNSENVNISRQGIVLSSTLKELENLEPVLFLVYAQSKL